MWQKHRVAVVAGVAAASVLVWAVRRAFRASSRGVFVVQDRQLLAAVPRLEDCVGAVQVVERVNGKHSALPDSGQFALATLLRAQGAGVAKYAGNILYVPVLTSTTTVMETCFPEASGSLLITCDEQTKGRGRTGAWVSNLGCLMFTYKFTCELQFALPVQTLIPLAMVLAITDELKKAQGSDYSLTHLRVKWPNDIYLGKVKIGGVLVESETRGALMNMRIGVGVNVDNEQPTTCLNSAFPGRFTREALLAQYLNHFDALVVRLKTEGHAALQSVYEERWYHRDTDAVFTPTGETVRLLGVDFTAGIRVRMAAGEERVVMNRDELKLNL